MKLNFAENLRKLRRGADMTQEQLAQKLCVSDQVVSRWETAVTYPDIELLPAIARLFDITVDELLGAKKAEDDGTAPKEVIDALSAIGDSDELYRQLETAHRDYPKDTRIFEILCSREQDIDKRRAFTEELLDNYPNQKSRWHTIKNMVLVETDEEKLEKFLDKYTTAEDFRRDVFLLFRLRSKGKLKEYEILRQKAALADINNLFARLNVERVKPKDPANGLWNVETVLRIINAFVGCCGSNIVFGDGEVDLWANYRIRCAVIRAGCLSALGKKEEAIKGIEDAYRFCERAFNMKDGTVLTYRSHAFEGAEALYTAKYITRPMKNGNEYRNLYLYIELIAKNSGERVAGESIAAWEICDDLNDWSWFDPIREDARVKSCVEQLIDICKREL